MITRVSFLPFDLGSPLAPGWSVNDSPAGMERIALPESDTRLIGFNVGGWISSQSGLEARISDQGFGLLVDRRSYDVDPSDHRGVASLLMDRSRLHRSAISNSHDLCETRAALEQHIVSMGMERVRPDLFGGFPYVLTIFIIEGDWTELAGENGAIQGLSAMLEPSRVSASDNDELELHEPIDERIAAAIGQIDPDESRLEMGDIDVGVNTFACASWAGVVAVCPPAEHHAVERAYTALETRVQLAWVMAHYSQKWCQQALRSGARRGEVDAVRWQVLPLLRKARSLSDASMSTRNARVFGGLVETSGLDEEITESMRAFEEVRDHAEYLREERTQRYEWFVELTLFVLAVTQIVPLFFEVPLVSANRWFLLAVILPVAVILLLRRSRDR